MNLITKIAYGILSYRSQAPLTAPGQTRPDNLNVYNSGTASTLHIVSLGSSFAAGPGIQPVTDERTGRSGNNYAHILAEALGARLTDLSVSGAVLPDLINDPAQVASVPADADLVTITGGGNDLGYVGGMMQDGASGSIVGRFLRYITSWWKVKAVVTAEEVAARFITIIDKVHELAPNARILLVEYLTLLGADVKAGIDVPFNQDRIDYHRGVAEEVKKSYRLAAEARPEVELIPIANLSWSHGIGAADHWVESSVKLPPGMVPFHPNLAGMRNIAAILYEGLQPPEQKSTVTS